MKNLIKKIIIFWSIKSAKEKNSMLIMSGLILVLSIWILWLNPVLNERQQLSQQLPELRHQLVHAYALTQKISSITDLSIQTAEISLEAIQKNLITAGLFPQKITVNNNLITPKFEKVSFSTLIKWTHDAQINYQILVVEASILSLDQLDQVDAVLIFKKLI